MTEKGRQTEYVGDETGKVWVEGGLGLKIPPIFHQYFCIHGCFPRFYLLLSELASLAVNRL